MSCITTITNSGTPIHHIEDEDDEFDWDAAVREIDVACQGVSLSSTAITSKTSTFSRHSLQENKNVVSRLKPSGVGGGVVCRQSTLDRFVQIKSSVNNHRSSNRGVVEEHRDNLQNGDAVGGDGNEKPLVTYCEIDFEAAKTWIYPVNIPHRDYQFSITKTALFANTMVALPTGLGKTLIAAVVMYNYYRWFPEGKIIFTAPSRPLVMQQIEACHNIVGIPQEWTIDLTGQTSPAKRACLWKDKRVFFATPQVLEKDIQSGTCLIKHIVCLVIDEAHRALGNYSYCVAIRELMDADLQFRILALTATPGSKQQTIQKIIDNLHISKLEYRSESDHDVIPYVHNRKLELIKVPMGKDAIEITDLLLETVRQYVAKLASLGVVFNRDIQTLSPIDFLNTMDRIRHANIKDAGGYLGVLISLYHVRKLLSSHGIKPAYEMLEANLHEGYMRLVSRNEMILKAKHQMEQNLSHGAQNPKLLKLIEILIAHFKTNDPKNSRVIIFSNFRESVRDIMNSLSSIGEYVKAAEFIGQSSGKTLKGQTQKIQQAVLQKFRAGGYNIIVATSIGEEGLDIMEVNLVICFDANVSSLRMIQRMGRTGRKNDGRVDILLGRFNSY
ncbi:Atp-dependent dna helicase mph1 [Thalictrum thalictroides]|uniref:Atp-dependent dna helicase mph1 n=1 Tax=Thalictrum thalictroides TaxID=46969 RepID=A0A7J6VI25_THATH|nr:Atp-dependent dna helicase mph1 [Thalictrum thalictroides]